MAPMAIVVRCFIDDEIGLLIARKEAAGGNDGYRGQKRQFAHGRFLPKLSDRLIATSVQHSGHCLSEPHRPTVARYLARLA